MKYLIRVVLALLVFVSASFVQAEVAVIVHPSAAMNSLSDDDIARLFLGKGKNFPDGSQAVPINQDEGSAVREKFNEAICKKNSSQYKAYWSQLVFTGKGTPPKDAGDDAAVKALISANPSMIGYIDGGAVDGSVKVVFKIP
jgi:ABC-type phosphate transport system substrate-binding protein